MIWSETESQSIPRELLPMMIASADGAAACKNGFRETSNIYHKAQRGEEALKYWAWNLGWRECAFLTQRAVELRRRA